jgi:hypothetical protein
VKALNVVQKSAGFWGAAKLLILERETGVEPATSSLGSWHSTTELLPLDRRSNHSKASTSAT